MAGCGRRDGQGPFWGDLVGANPTDRGKNGVKRSLLVEADGGPLSVVIAGANVPDFKLLEATLDAVVIERPRPSQSSAPQHLCLDKGYDKGPALEEAVVPRLHLPHKAHWRREARRGGRETLSGEKMGGGTHAGLALEVPSHPDTIRKEGHELPGTHQGRLYLAVVPSSAPLVPFEIVT